MAGPDMVRLASALMLAGGGALAPIALLNYIARERMTALLCLVWSACCIAGGLETLGLIR